MSKDVPARRTFTLAEAQQMLTRVRVLTEQAMADVDQLSRAVRRMPKTDPARAATLTKLDGVVAAWIGQVQRLGPEVRGLGLVDFDNGDGYYCWKYPESAVLHYHGYGEGFAGRMKIV